MKKELPESSKAILRAIDIFDKFDNDELTQRTKFGAFVSICLSIFAGIYLTIKVIRFFTPKIYRDLSLTAMLIDQQDFVNISVAVRVNLPCYFLHLDAIDSLGVTQLDLNSTANMRRFSKSGHMIGVANETLKDMCYPCHGILPDDMCCNSCEQLVVVAMMKGLPATPEKWEQCKGRKKPPSVSLDETCLIKGKVSVNKVNGEFHIAPGRNDIRGGQHNHDLSFGFPNLDLSHTIESIRFGPVIPTANNPLRGIKVTQGPRTAMSYKYTMMVTPVVYIKDRKERTRGYEYTAMVTSHQVYPGEAPGIFFKYSFTPYTVTVNAKSRSLAQFVTSTSGFLSGAFAAAMMFDLFAERTGLARLFERVEGESKAG